MKRLLCSVAFAFMATAGAAQAEIYGEVFGGAVFQPDMAWGGSTYDMDTGFNVGAAVGAFVSPNVSIEGELMYTQAQYSCCENNLESLSAMANAVYHFDTGDGFQPYVGAGLGAVRVVYDNVSYEREDTVFGWQAMAGGAFPVSDAVSLFVEYRYQDAQDAEDSGLEWEYMSHNVSGGLRVRF